MSVRKSLSFVLLGAALFFGALFTPSSADAHNVATAKAMRTLATLLRPVEDFKFQKQPTITKIGRILHGTPAVGCTTPCPAPALTWSKIVAQNGNSTLRPYTNWGPGGPNYPGSSTTPCADGMFALWLPSGYSWACGGESWMGETQGDYPGAPGRWGNTGTYNSVAHTSQCEVVKGFVCTAMAEFSIVYVRATTLAANVQYPTVAGTNVIFQNRFSACHYVAGGWFEAQRASTSNPIDGARYDAPQTSGVALTINDLGGGVFSEQAPPGGASPGSANHDYIRTRGSYTAQSVDFCLSYMEARVDQPGDHHIASCGMDWYQFPFSGSAPTANTGMSESNWIELTQDWQPLVCTSGPLPALQAASTELNAPSVIVGILP